MSDHLINGTEPFVNRGRKVPESKALELRKSGSQEHDGLSHLAV